MQETFIPGALKTALNFEDKGQNYYAKTAAAVTDPLSKKLFETLSADEVKHAEKIKAIFTSLSEETTLPIPDFEHQAHLENTVKRFFENNKASIKKNSNNAEGYLFAMEMEKTGIEMYRKFAGQTDHAGEKAFYEELIKEEMEHLEALKNVHFFLTDSENWLAEDESHHWNWMSL